MEITKKHYQYITHLFAALALLWAAVGFYTYDFYFALFKPHLIPDGPSFNIFHEGVVLLFSGLGTITGITNVKKYKVWSASFFINVIVLCIMILMFFA